MAKKNVDTPADSPSERKRRLPVGWALVLSGIVLVGSATWLAQHFDVGTKFQLDARGTRAQGKAEPLPEGAFRISYKHPTGTIYARRFAGSLGLQRPGANGAIVISYDASDPEKFQPAWLSILPGVPSLCLFLAGFSCVLRARRLVMRARRTPPVKKA